MANLQGFHADHGYTFERDPDTEGVTLRLYSQHEQTLLEEVTFPASTWASVVASVSARGENHETFTDALAFHNRK